MARKKKNQSDFHGGRMRVPRSRGAVSGVLLVVLGIWGALIPLVGPYVDFGFTPDKSFHFDSARFWLEIVPGAAAAVGGFLLLVAANRVVTSFGAWLAAASGAWFLVGSTLGRLLHLGSPGVPIHKSTLGSTLETLLLFTGIGVAILWLAAIAIGRLGVVSVRDVKSAQRREAKSDHDHDADSHTGPAPQANSTRVPAYETNSNTQPIAHDSRDERRGSDGATSLESHRD